MVHYNRLLIRGILTYLRGGPISYDVLTLSCIELPHKGAVLTLNMSTIPFDHNHIRILQLHASIPFTGIANIVHNTEIRTQAVSVITNAN